jgi:DNA polymerase III subunit epsilon
VVPLRRCSSRLPADAAGRRASPCTAAQLGVASCPCSGSVAAEEYGALVLRLVDALSRDPAALLDPLSDRLSRLSVQQRFEEAGDLRDRAGALARALERQRRHDAVRGAGRIELDLGDGAWAVIEGGTLCAAGGGPAGQPRLPLAALAAPPAGEPGEPVRREAVDEVATIASWLDVRAAKARIVTCEGGLAWTAPRLPGFEPAVRAGRPLSRDPRALRGRAG